MNTNTGSYSNVAKFFHWSIAFMILFNLISGATLAYFDAFSTQINLFAIHKQTGVMILVLAVLRLTWRLTHRYPSLKGMLPAHERLLAGFGHVLLYILMFALPISGILFSQSFGKEVDLLWIKLPTFIDPQAQGVALQFLNLHKFLAIIITTIVAGHTLAAIKHHIIDKNQVLTRMLPKFGAK